MTIVTAANQPYWRCLYQLLRSAERRDLARRHGFIAYDLGLAPATARRLARRFGWCEFRRFPDERYPPHVAVERGTCAWKPIIIADVMDEVSGHVLWLDSATIFKGNLDEVAAVLRRDGTYTLKGQTALAGRCDPATLAAMAVEPELLHLPERAAGVIGLDAGHPGARRLVAQWREHALIEAHIWPRTPRLPRHRPEQSLLTILLYRLEAAGELRLNDDEIDISSRAPIRWMTSRNKVRPWLPRWADPAARAWYWSYKAVDQRLWALSHWRRARVDGLHRWPKEHFSVFLARAGTGEAVPVRAPASRYYADPFLWRRDGQLWLFVEEFVYGENRGRLCCLPIDDRLRAGTPRPVLASRRCHLSFPYLFEHAGALYLVPESCADSSIDLYVCEAFPDRWRLRRRLVYGVDAADTVVIRHEGLWWLITAQRDSPAAPSRYLAIYVTDDLLTGGWRPHPVNGERRYDDEPFNSWRNAGPMIQEGGVLLRAVQDNRRYYGESLKLTRVAALTPTEFRETPITGGHPLADLAARVSPHHVATFADIVAWDVRDRVGYAQHVPLWRRWAFRPDPRVARLMAATR